MAVGKSRVRAESVLKLQDPEDIRRRRRSGTENQPFRVVGTEEEMKSDEIDG